MGPFTGSQNHRCMESCRRRITGVQQRPCHHHDCSCCNIAIKCEVRSGFSSRGIYLKERWRPRSDLWSRGEWPNVIESWLHLCISLALCIPINIVCALCWQLDALRDHKDKHRKVLVWGSNLGWNWTISSKHWEGGRGSAAGGRSWARYRITGTGNRLLARNIRVSVLLDSNKLI